MDSETADAAAAMESKSGDELAQASRLNQILKGSNGESQEEARNLAALLVDRCSNFIKSDSVTALWKQLDDVNSNLLRNLLTSLERCADARLAVSLVRLLDMYVRRSAKGRKTRIRLVVSLNGVTSIMKCLLTFLSQPTLDLETIEPLIYLLLLFGGVDKKFHVKVRLTGVLKAASESCRNSAPISLSIFDLLIAAAQSGQNAILLGKQKETVAYLFETIRKHKDQPSEVCRKALEVAYYLAKIGKNRNRLASAGGISLTLEVFNTYFANRLENERAMKMCLISLGTLRLITRTKSGLQELLELKGLETFTSAVRSCLEANESKFSTPLSKELDTAICAVCLRCLPAKPLPFDRPEHFLQFRLPSDAERLPGEEVSDSDDDQNEAPGYSETEDDIANFGDGPTNLDRKVQVTELEKEYSKFCPEFQRHMSAANFILKPLRNVASFDQLGVLERGKKNGTSTINTAASQLQNRKAAAAATGAATTTVTASRNRTRRRSSSVSELRNIGGGTGGRGTAPRSETVISSNRSRLTTPPRRLAPLLPNSRRLSLEEVQPRRHPWKSVDYTTDEYAKHAAETKSVVPFTKIAYPEFSAGYPDLPLQPLKEFPGALLRRVLQEIENTVNEHKFMPRTVFDADALFRAHPERASPLTNNDKNRIGIKHENADHVVFESRFECGNLRKVIQVGPYEYELFLNADINQLQHHCLWFYFEASNVEADVPYTFTLANCVKSQSLFQTGVQPVVFSVTEAEHGRPGWARCGQMVVYYKNRYTRPGKKATDAKSFYSASFTVAFRHSWDVCYFAYHYPYAYTMMKANFLKMEQTLPASRGIYYRRDVLCETLCKNPVFLITITATGTPAAMARRDSIVLSARVHPGEANSSWMMHGTMQFLLSDDLKAKEARERFVFKLVPMLNPDGVINGNHRCSLAGQDLNRQWVKPSQSIHPTIYHFKNLLTYLYSIGKAPLVFCDYHGHSRKKNVFIYGNNPQLSWWPPDHTALHNYEFYSLPEILGRIAPGFWLRYSSFAIQKDKEGSGRVAVWRELGVTRAYTMEASYGGFDRGPYQGYQIGTRQCIEMGKKFCEGLIVLKEQALNNQLPLRTFEESDDDSVVQPPQVGK